LAAYRSHYDRTGFYSGHTVFTVPEFKRWLERHGGKGRRIAKGGGDSYPDAGKSAPPGVKREVARLKPRASGKTPLLYLLLGDGTPAYKMSKADAAYVDKSKAKDQVCGNCRFIFTHPPTGETICSQVRGAIKPAGWCRLWKLAES
jgi:hypothetical protein